MKLALAPHSSVSCVNLCARVTPRPGSSVRPEPVEGHERNVLGNPSIPLVWFDKLTTNGPLRRAPTPGFLLSQEWLLNCFNAPLPVIPVKTGIQVGQWRHPSTQRWIPAFAGMAAIQALLPCTVPTPAKCNYIFVRQGRKVGHCSTAPLPSQAGR